MVKNKVLKADDVRKLKGLYNNVALKANDILSIASDFFINNSLDATLYIFPVRFIERCGAPPCGYVDCTTEVKWLEVLEKKYDYSDDDRLYVIDNNLVCFPTPVVFVDYNLINELRFILATLGGYIVKKGSYFSSHALSVTLL